MRYSLPCDLVVERQRTGVVSGVSTRTVWTIIHNFSQDVGVVSLTNQIRPTGACALVHG